VSASDPDVPTGPESAVQSGGPSTRVVVAESDKGGDEVRANIAVLVDEQHVEVAVTLPPADASAARARIADPVRALQLTTAFEALPEQFAIGVAGDEARAPAPRASNDQLRALFDRAEREQRALWLGWSIPREVAVAHAVLLDEQLEDAVVALGSVLALLAQPPGRHAPVPREPAASRRRDKRDASRGEDDRPGAKRRARARDEGTALSRAGHSQYPEQGDREPEPAAEPDAREYDGAGSPRAQRASFKGPVRAGVRLRRSRGADSGRSIEKGSHVRVLDGAFCGKVGVVQEVDAKGRARVMLGLLAVRVDVRDLARCAEGRNRPLLSTSHRKRMPVRS
jgi:KOW motif-containing protein